MKKLFTLAAYLTVHFILFGIEEGLLVWYPFDSDVTDASGNGFHATNHGASFSEGLVGNAATFDGNGQYIQTPNFDQILNHDKDWTLSFLFNSQSWNLFTGSDGGSGSIQFGIASYVVKITNRAESASDWRVDFTSPVSGLWHLLTCTWGHSGVLRIYIDGTLVGEDLTGALKDFYPTRNPLIGASNNGFNNRIDSFLIGQIDEFRIYNRTLSPAEVSSLASAAGLGGLWGDFANYENGWRASPWFGFINPSAAESNWAYHQEHGWVYSVSESTDNLTYWTPQTGYVWTSDMTYPWVYQYSSQQWLYYLKDSGDQYYNQLFDIWIPLVAASIPLEWTDHELGKIALFAEELFPGGILSNYEAGQKWLLRVGGAIPVLDQIGFDIGASIVIDMVDYVSAYETGGTGVSPEGSDSWVSVYLLGELGLLAPGVDYISFVPFQFLGGFPEDLYRGGNVSFANLNLPNFSGSLIRTSEGFWEGDLRPTSLSIGLSLLTAAFDIYRFEIRKDFLDAIFDSAMAQAEHDVVVTAEVWNSFISEFLTNAGEVKELGDVVRDLTIWDDGTNDAVAKIAGYSKPTVIHDEIYEVPFGSPTRSFNLPNLFVGLENPYPTGLSSVYLRVEEISEGWKIHAAESNLEYLEELNQFDLKYEVAQLFGLTSMDTNWILAKESSATYPCKIELGLYIDNNLWRQDMLLDTQVIFVNDPATTPGSAASFSLIPAGTFTMGSPTDEPGRDSDETQHTVTLTRAFFLQTTEVTKAEWDAVRAEGPARGYNDLPEGGNGYNGESSGTHPVTEISWVDAVKWLNLKSELEGLTPCYTYPFVGGGPYRTGQLFTPACNFNADGYRLPTESEWEYAARAGTTTAFYSGPITHTENSPLDPNLDLIGWYGGNSNGNTHPVGGKNPNAWGLYDMSGNVFEYCWDWYDSYPGTVTDPTGTTTIGNRVLRGGSWFNRPQFCRSALRRSSYPGNDGPSGGGSTRVGFRPARTASE